MNKNLLNVKNLSFSNQNNDSLGAITQIAKKDIAIIGICGQFGNAVDHKEFWNSIRSGKDLIREFPESRKKHIDQYYSNKGAKDEHQKEYFIGAYLDNIDEFDYSHFSLSPKEADLMDPHQRLFLQTAWKAIEDAGYGGNKIKGSKTGIFVGYSADFGEDYREIIRTNDPDSLELSVVPNLRSIIASRIAYVLDLTGPSLVVDTACSSSLMAVHLACKSIRQNECEMAIAGSIRLLLMPTKKDKEYRIGLEKILGVESDSGRARTFDETSDGTGLGEGMGALILKPLSKAIEDKDYIYAVIKGSAANQDGNSVGITAPNSEAQAKVIIQAWKDAGINPETVSYIEAHGTGTNLGDPIEINGLQRAFRKFTNKKQFCGIGSLKTNIGHLDNASGIASMIKVSMSLVNREIAPSLNFNYPNKKINFVGSPIYVNDSLREWQVSGHPRRCGVSAFGLSGTNCHIILEEAPEIQDRKSPQTTEDRIMTISASSAEALVLLIAEYRKFLTSNPDIDMEALCYTAATGRGHYAYRISLIVSDQRDLLKRLELIKNIDDLMSCKELYYKEHRVVSTSDLVLSEIEITEDHKSSLTLDAQNIIQETDWNNIDRYEVLDKICRLYINGASIDWEEYYTKQGKKINKIPIPTYQFSKKRCWVKTVRRASRQLTANKKEIERPLVDRMLINLNDFSVYETVFNVEKDWVLNEHKILGQYLVPGTTYIEMIREIIDNSYNYNKFQLSGVTFMSPMIVAHGENREVNTILRKNNNLIEFTVSSRSSLSEASTIHAVGNINFSSPVIEGGSISINELKGRMIEENINTIIQEESDRTDIEVGGRWDCARRIFKGDNEYLAFIELPSVYEKDLDSFIIHPSLMDCGVNVLNTIISSELYLPFTYKNIKYYNPLQKSFWCYLKRSQKGSAETISFDIKFISNDEKLLMDIEEYTIKKVNTMDFNSEKSDDDNYFKLEWKESTIEKKASFPSKGSVLFFKGQNSIANEIAARLKKEGCRIIEVREGGAFEKVDDDRYTIGASCDDLESLLEHINENTFNYIVHSYALSQSDENISLELLNTEFNSSLLSLFNLTKV
ncbi:MAG: beta-ketoacyl synthase N-terminal-like domain-containing protein, partial [Bacillota bacterium]|nr:beta-ketoacyl synthase N-terminal-like domain-containing protein [Bacillota bacterium]